MLSRDDVIRMAREAGAEFWADTIIVNGKDADDFMVAFAAAAYSAGQAVERDACAKVCDGRAMKNENAAQEAESDEDATGLRAAAWQIGICAAAIRARGEVKP